MRGGVVPRDVRPILTCIIFRFAEYETLLDVEAEEHPLRDVVDHLVYWRKARVVDVVSLKGHYAVSATLDTTK